jgi:hypothetical protein
MNQLAKCLGGGHQIAALYVVDDDNDGGLVVRWNVASVGQLHELRDQVLQGQVDRILSETLQPVRSGLSVQADRSAFAREYETSILKLDKLTPHQQRKLAECPDDADVHLQAPAGAGKTFLGLHRVVETLKRASATRILFVARNPALCLFVAKWIHERLRVQLKMRNAAKRRKMLSRVHVLCHPLEDGPRSIAVKHKRVVFEKPSVDAVTGNEGVPYSLVVVDEAHHLYRDDRARHTIESFVTPGASKRMLLSDISQSTQYDIPYPQGMASVTLEEVVRCSKRVVAGAMAFQVGGEKLLTKCHHKSTGPPLLSFLFDMEEGKSAIDEYASEAVKAVSYLVENFPGLNFDRRLAIVVPDDAFASGFREPFKSQLRALFQRWRTF